MGSDGSFLRDSLGPADARQRDKSHLAVWVLVCLLDQSCSTTLRSHLRSDCHVLDCSSQKGASW